MTRSFNRIALLLLAVTVLLGCDQGRQSLPEVSVRVVNAAPSYSTVVFRREEVNENVASLGYVALAYRQADAFSFDQDQYDFHFEHAPPGAAPVRYSFDQSIVAEKAYTFVATEVGGLIVPVVLEYPPLATSSAETQFVVLHAGAALAPMDIYIELPGTNVATAIPKGSLAFGQSLAPFTLAAGEYEVTLTERGNPANVLLSSTTVGFAAAASSTLVIVDEANQGIAPLSIVLAGPNSGVLVDKNLQSALRVINGAVDGAARDVAINSQFTPPLFAAVPFATQSAYALVPPGENPVNVTPAGNPGVLELTQTLTNLAGAKQTMVFTGADGTLTHVLVTDEGRSIVDESKLRFVNVAPQFTAIDIFVVTPGTDVTGLAASTSIVAPSATTFFGFAPGTYDLILRQYGTANVIYGPLPIVLTAGGISTVVISNGADAATANAVQLD